MRSVSNRTDLKSKLHQKIKRTWCLSVQSDWLRVNNINCQSCGEMNTLIIVRVNGMTFTLTTDRNMQHAPFFFGKIARSAL